MRFFTTFTALSILATTACGGWQPRHVDVSTDQPDVFDVNVVKPFAVELIGQLEDMSGQDLTGKRFKIRLVDRGGEHNCYGRVMNVDIVGCHSSYGDVHEIDVLAVADGTNDTPQIFWHAMAHELGHALEQIVKGNRKDHRRRKFWAGAAGTVDAPPRNGDGSLGIVPQLELWLGFQDFPYSGDNLAAVIYTEGEFGRVEDGDNP